MNKTYLLILTKDYNPDYKQLATTKKSKQYEVDTAREKGGKKTEEKHEANKHMKRCLLLLTIREM